MKRMNKSLICFLESSNFKLYEVSTPADEKYPEPPVQILSALVFGRMQAA